MKKRKLIALTACTKRLPKKSKSCKENFRVKFDDSNEGKVNLLEVIVSGQFCNIQPEKGLIYSHLSKDRKKDTRQLTGDYFTVLKAS